jgi:uncharacterized Zn finger protein
MKGKKMSKCPKCGDNHATQLMVWMDGRDLLKCEKCGQQYIFPAEMPKMTNGDKIRQMSNKEMAVMFRTDIKQCPPGECHDDGCIECWLEWLNSEVEK